VIDRKKILQELAALLFANVMKSTFNHGRRKDLSRGDNSGFFQG